MVEAYGKWEQPGHRSTMGQSLLWASLCSNQMAFWHWQIMRYKVRNLSEWLKSKPQRDGKQLLIWEKRAVKLHVGWICLPRVISSSQAIRKCTSAFQVPPELSPVCKGLLVLKFSGTVGSVLFSCGKFGVSHVVQTINKNSDRKFPGGLRLLGWLHTGWTVLEGAVWVGSLSWEGRGGSEQLDDSESRHWAVSVTVLWVACSVFVSEAKNFRGKATDAEWPWPLPAILCVSHTCPRCWPWAIPGVSLSSQSSGFGRAACETEIPFPI